MPPSTAPRSVSGTLLPSPAEWAIAIVLAAPPAALTWWWLGEQTWHGRPSTCFPSACFCEAVRQTGIRQPANTLSSFAFLPIAALVVIRLIRRLRSTPPVERTRGLLARDPVYSILFAGALTVIGLGSAFLHASLTFVGQAVDVSGMYLLGTFAVLYAVSRFRTMSWRSVALSFVAVNTALILLLLTVPSLRRYAFGLIVVLAIALELRARRIGLITTETRYLGAAIGLIALGVLIWGLDLSRVVCVPTGLVQGHAVWHLLTALAAGSLYLHYDSESGSLEP